MTISSLAVLLSALMTILTFPGYAFGQERALKESAALPPNRIALLIGNSDYTQTTPNTAFRPLKTLRNPCNDITGIAGILEQAGWNPEREIISVCNATRSRMMDAVEEFKNIYLSDNRSIGFIFYAGHGVQIYDEMYLFGIDASMNVERAVDALKIHKNASVFRGGVRLYSDLISQVGDAGAGIIFIVIDACRETPIDRVIRSNGALAQTFVNASRGYRKPIRGIKLLFSTAYGALAGDGVAGGSPFALAFHEHLKQQGLITNLIPYVVNKVIDDTQYTQIPQIPDESGTFNPPPPVPCLTICGESR